MWNLQWYNYGIEFFVKFNTEYSWIAGLFFILQHGESEYNRIGRLGGDSPLSANGIEYAKKLRDYFKVFKFLSNFS